MKCMKKKKKEGRDPDRGVSLVFLFMERGKREGRVCTRCTDNYFFAPFLNDLSPVFFFF